MAVLEALSGPHGDQVRSLLETSHPYADAVVNDVIEIVRAGGHVDASLAEASRHLELASGALSRVPDSDAREILEGLGDYLLGRVGAARAT
jgi:geranylgeranyl pyrophosphate synthase